MPGPLPKDPKLRQRQNKVATQATLQAQASRRRVPPMPECVDEEGQPKEWHKMTKAFWRDVWRSPMAPEFLQADIHGLYLLVKLIDKFWEEPSIALAGEIRLQRQCFGLTPIDRRRLQWEVEKVEEVLDKKRTPKQSAPPPKPADDPRKLLSIV